MIIFLAVPPSLLLTAALCFFSTISSAAAEKPFELATAICKNTTDFNYCRDVVFSDPRAVNGEAADLAYVIFGVTYKNATNTQKYIDSQIKSNPGAASLRALNKCRVNYQEIYRTLVYDMLGNLDSESYYEFDKSSLHLENEARDCEKGLQGRSAMTKRNADLIKLAGICYSVALYFPYS